MIGPALRHWFAHPQVLYLLAILPLLSIVGAFAWYRRQRLLARFGTLAALAALTDRFRSSRLRSLCLAVALALLIIGSAGPQWGRDPTLATAPGRDLVAVLDLSRSMLADDVLPNRADHAKEALLDLADTVQQRGGQRLGLVIFAVHAKVVCPLTHDYDYFRDKVEELDPAFPPPEIRPGPDDDEVESGTRIGKGLEAAVKAHVRDRRGYQDILLISDGDDPAHDDEWQAGVAAAAKEEIPIYVVGVGDPKEGGKIPTPDGFYLRYEGKVVESRLMEQLLEKIAHQTGGKYIPARTDPVQLGELYRTTIEPGRREEIKEDLLPIYQQRYPWFMGLALLLLTADMTLGSIVTMLGKVNGRKKP